MSNSNQSLTQKNPWYPRHVSARADELIDELDETQLRRLFDALKTKNLTEWLIWLEEARAEICKYDDLKRAERKRQLQKKNSTDALLLHHACIFVELWRARTNAYYFPLPPTGAPIDDSQTQREMMLAILTSYNAFNARDLWPFDFPEGENEFPFSEESS